MKALFAAQRPSRSDLLLVAAYWAVVASVLLVQYQSDTGGRIGWRIVPLVGLTVVFDTLTVAVLVGGLLPLLLGRRGWLGLALLPVFLLASGLAYRCLYDFAFGQVIVLTFKRILLGTVGHAKSYGLLAVLLTGKRYAEAQQRLLKLQKMQAENELRNLKAQIDPHFLFNNLNVLRGMVQDNPAAGEFLTRLAALYRFLIRHQNEDVVGLAEELQFADEYVYLLRHRFGAAYEFRQQLPPPAAVADLLVVPGTVQLLLENAVKHNAGNEDDPLVVCLEINGNCLVVGHIRRPKHTPVDSPGTGLANLRERYRLLFGLEIGVEATAAAFIVTVPLPRQARRPTAFAPQPANA